MAALVVDVTVRDGAVLAAGAVVWRAGGGGRVEVCLIHRPKYDDWSLPKGKIDAGEHVLAGAAREVFEETGHDVVLGRPLSTQRYEVTGGAKQVRYWLAEADPDAAPRDPDAEVDDVVFVPVVDALERLTHRRDAELVAAAMRDPLRTAPMVLMRHTKAIARDRWDGPDPARPLDATGVAEAEALVSPLATLGIRRVVSSDATRCVDTVRPFAARGDHTIELEPRLSEECVQPDHAPQPAVEVARGLLADDTATLACSHRPVLPILFGAAGIDPPPPMSPGGFLVVHHSGGRVVATDLHDR